MKVLVIGSTGHTGRLALRRLLDGGHEVTAFARDPSALSQAGKGLRVFQGDARDPLAVDKAMEGQDAVFCAIGPRALGKTDLQEKSLGNIVAAMEKHGVKRIVNLSAMGCGDSRGQAPWFFRAVIVPLLLKGIFQDKERGEAYLLSSALDYVNVRPGRLTTSPARGGVKASLDSKGLKAYLSYEDLADFMVRQLTENEWLRQSPLIGY